MHIYMHPLLKKSKNSISQTSLVLTCHSKRNENQTKDDTQLQVSLYNRRADSKIFDFMTQHSVSKLGR